MTTLQQPCDKLFTTSNYNQMTTLRQPCSNLVTTLPFLYGSVCHEVGTAILWYGPMQIKYKGYTSMPKWPDGWLHAATVWPFFSVNKICGQMESVTCACLHSFSDLARAGMCAV